MKRLKTWLLSLCCLAFLFTAAACSSGPSPTDVSKGFLGALKEANYEKAGSYVDKSDTSVIKSKIPGKDENSEKIGKIMLSKFTFEVGESKIDGDKATVKVKITSLDMVRIVSKTMSEIMPLAFASAFSSNGQQNINNLLEQHILNSMSDPKAPMTTTDTIINLIKTKDGWKIAQDNDELFNAITGNVMKAFSDQSQAKTTPKMEKTKYKVGEEIKLFDGVLITVTNVEKSNGNEFDKPRAGNEFIIAHINIVNGAKENISYDPFAWKLRNSNGQISEPSFTTIDKDTHLESGELAVGGKVSGTIPFEAPIGDQGLKLIYAPSVLGGQEIEVSLQ